jgi:hypothetical protein
MYLLFFDTLISHRMHSYGSQFKIMSMEGCELAHRLGYGLVTLHCLGVGETDDSTGYYLLRLTSCLLRSHYLRICYEYKRHIFLSLLNTINIWYKIR